MAYENLIHLGFVLIIAGFILVMIESLTGKDVKIGVGGFIGPFAFGWANDPQMLKWIIALTIVMAVIFVLLLAKGVRL